MPKGYPVISTSNRKDGGSCLLRTIPTVKMVKTCIAQMMSDSTDKIAVAYFKVVSQYYFKVQIRTKKLSFVINFFFLC
jgi:hypothetical protein